MVSFPTSLDAFTNPLATDVKNDPTVLHHEQHTDANDAIEALEAKVGIDGSAVPTSLDYIIANLALEQSYPVVVNQGGVVDSSDDYAVYTVIGQRVNAEIRTVMGALAAGSSGSAIFVTIPVDMARTDAAVIGQGSVTDASGLVSYPVFVTTRGGANVDTVQFCRADQPSFLTAVGTDPAFGLAPGDDITVQFTYIKAP